jgi:hypothetical protein
VSAEHGDARYEFHEIANIFPLLQGAELAALVDDIRANGLREPIWLYQNKILDGRNRYTACGMAGVEPTFNVYTEGNPIGFVVSLNLLRRHLDESQRAMAGKRLATMRQGARTDLQPAANLPEVSQAKAAELLNVSERSIRHAGTVINQGVPELVKAVEHGEVAVSVAAEVAKLPEVEQREAVAGGKSGIKAALAPVEQQQEREQATRSPEARERRKKTGGKRRKSELEALRVENERKESERNTATKCLAALLLASFSHEQLQEFIQIARVSPWMISVGQIVELIDVPSNAQDSAPTDPTSDKPAATDRPCADQAAIADDQMPTWMDRRRSTAAGEAAQRAIGGSAP